MLVSFIVTTLLRKLRGFLYTYLVNPSYVASIAYLKKQYISSGVVSVVFAAFFN